MPASISTVALAGVLLTTLSLVLVAIAVRTWRRRRMAPEAEIFSLLVLSAAIYCFGYAGEIAQTTLNGAELWLHVEYFGIPWIPALWLLGARLHRGLKSRAMLLFIIPVLTFAGHLTNPLHWLYDRSVTLAFRDPFWVVTVVRGPIAWLNVAYLNFALFYGAWLYLTTEQPAEPNRLQGLLMVSVPLLPLCGYMVYLFGWSPWGLDLAPPLLGISVFLGYAAIFRLGILDLVPMAHLLVFSNMRDGVVVTDLQHRLVACNPAAREILPALGKAFPGQLLSSVLREQPEAARVLACPDGAERLQLPGKDQRVHYDVRLFPLYHGKIRVGSAAILDDITAHVGQLLELRHNAETDVLTGIANRRSFLASMEREYARSVRYKQPFSIALLDVDRFKEVNDTLGHDVGDTVLMRVTSRILGCIRTSDLLCRYGGDEFAILLPQTGSKGAQELSERICRAVSETALDIRSHKTVYTSLSIGVAALEAGQETDWNLLLKRADKALYKAKADGRNRVAAWSEELDEDPLA